MAEYDIELDYLEKLPSGSSRLQIFVDRDVTDKKEIARLKFKLSNNSNKEIKRAITTGVPAPFGVLKATNDHMSFCLWSESYSSDQIHTKEKRIVGRVKSMPIITIPPGRSVEEVYSIRRDEYSIKNNGLQAGVYEIVEYEGNPLTIEQSERRIKLEITNTGEESTV
jgi:hypothetical protein